MTKNKIEFIQEFVLNLVRCDAQWFVCTDKERIEHVVKSAKLYYEKIENNDTIR